MNTDILRQWRYYGATEDIRSFGVPKDQFLAGKNIGFIAVADALPKPPGHVANPYSFPFPVRYSLAEGIRAGETHSDDEVIAALRKTAVSSNGMACALFQRRTDRLPDSSATSLTL